MPAEGELNILPYCWAPADLVTAVELSRDVLRRLVVHAGQLAMLHQEVVAIRGCSDLVVSFCRAPCRYSHHGSVLVIPDLAVAEIFANGGSLDQLQWIAGVDGRSVAICAVE
jgi:hypothetical protein